MNFQDNAKHYKTMKWHQIQFNETTWSFLLGASKLHYIHKIERDDGTNVYIVPEDLYLKTIDKIKK